MSKKINISVVGLGLMGAQHLKAILKSKKSNLHSIVDISDNAKKLSAKYKIQLHSNDSSLLNSKELDAVIVATPNSCLLYTSPSPRDRTRSRMPSSA